MLLSVLVYPSTFSCYTNTIILLLGHITVLWHCWLGGRKGIQPVKKWGRLVEVSLVSPNGMAPSRMVDVSVSVNLPLHHKVQKFSSGTGSPIGCPGKGPWNGCVVVVVSYCNSPWCFEIERTIVKGSASSLASTEEISNRRRVTYSP